MNKYQRQGNKLMTEHKRLQKETQRITKRETRKLKKKVAGFIFNLIIFYQDEKSTDRFYVELNKLIRENIHLKKYHWSTTFFLI